MNDLHDLHPPHVVIADTEGSNSPHMSNCAGPHAVNFPLDWAALARPHLRRSQEPATHFHVLSYGSFKVPGALLLCVNSSASLRIGSPIDCHTGSQHGGCLMNADFGGATCADDDAEASSHRAQGLRPARCFDHHVCTGVPLQPSGPGRPSSVLRSARTAATCASDSHPKNTCVPLIHLAFAQDATPF